MRFGLGRKLFAIYLGLALAIGAALVASTVGLGRIANDARRVLEENREARLAARIVSALDHLSPEALDRAHAGGALEPSMAEARAALTDMIEGAGTTDPSEEGHQSEETAMAARITADLDAIEDWLRRSPVESLEVAVSRRLSESRRLAESLSHETDEEAHKAAEHLLGAIHRLRELFLLSAGLSLGVLIAGFALVHRNLVRPVRSLREGTRRFGAGELDRRVPVESGDEIGDLAREFNAMADRLSRSHRDLEQRVEARTRQFYHAARLAGLGTLAAGIAHEVNTPLATIASCAEGLQRRARARTLDPETQLSYSETIVREAYRAREITGHVLDFARKDPGEMEVQALEPSLRDAAHMLERLCVERGVRLQVDIADDLPPVGINRSEIRQAVVNLLKNAVEATPGGGAVRLSARSLGDGISVEVRDEGPGIPAEHRDEIFDPFFTTKPASAGTGLGLSLVFGIVERHDGSVELDESTTERGALFRIVLPVPAVEARP
jgi:signal transduction histidine kinase